MRLAPVATAASGPLERPGVDARGEWVARQQRPLWRFVRMLGCAADQADDLVQEALLAALHKGLDARPDPEAARWLRGAVRNLWRMHLRAARRRPTHVDLEQAEQAERAMLRHGDRDGGEAFVEALRACVAGLDGRARVAIELRYRDDASRAAMATALAMTEDGIKTLLRRTREVLFTCVQRRVVSERRAAGEQP